MHCAITSILETKTASDTDYCWGLVRSPPRKIGRCAEGQAVGVDESVVALSVGSVRSSRA